MPFHVCSTRFGAVTPFALIAAASAPLHAGDELTVVSVEPAAHALTAPVGSAVTVRFDRPVLRSSVTGTTFWAFGRWSGAVAGTFAFSDDDRVVSLVPDHPFTAGEQVMVILSHDLVGMDGSPFRGAGYSCQFWTRSRRVAPRWTQIASMTTRTTPGVRTRSYGGIATDLNRDGFLDLTIVNEDTGDLRVFLNRADGTGLYHPFLRPTFPVNDRASPSEPTDFNHDGFADICVVNINTDSVSVLLGNGDGTFRAQQEITVGATPRGIAVLDADGDGDTDIVNTNSDAAGGGNLSLLLNDGEGGFGAPAFFQGGVTNEWALAACDMDDDAVLDLVVGGRQGQQVVVDRGDGDGTFTPLTPRASGGAVWMLVCGDVNGDGTEDVATANSSTNNGAVLLGNGMGGLGPAATFPTDPFPLADDLGDIDGDGDLDWVLSSFNGDWRLLLNNGAGTFAFNREFNSPQAASCALMLDFDNDRDLDLALIDELADVVILMENTACHADFDADGTLDSDDFFAFLDAFFAAGEEGDFDADGATDSDDFFGFLTAFFGGCA